MCLLYHWSLGNQTRCADLLLIVTKPSTTKWAYTDSSTLTYSISKHTMVGILPGKVTNLVTTDLNNYQEYRKRSRVFCCCCCWCFYLHLKGPAVSWRFLCKSNHCPFNAQNLDNKKNKKSPLTIDQCQVKCLSVSASTLSWYELSTRLSLSSTFILILPWLASVKSCPHTDILQLTEQSYKC